MQAEREADAAASRSPGSEGACSVGKCHEGDRLAGCEELRRWMLGYARKGPGMDESSDQRGSRSLTVLDLGRMTK